MKTERIQTFKEFWPFYLGEHRRPVTRWMHWFGTNLGLAFLIFGLSTQRPIMLLPGLVSAYAFAWVSHFFLEKNRPATFSYPLWSFVADFKMWALMWTGRLDAKQVEAS